MEKKRTINLMISPEADNRLRALSAELKQAMGVIVERAIMQYQPIETDQPGDKEDRLLALESRVMALESRLEGLGAVGVVSMPEADKMPIAADLKPSVVAVAVDVSGETVETVAVETVKNRAVNNEAEFDALVKQYGAKEGGGFMGVQATVKALRQVAKVQAKQERVGASLERVKGVQNDGQT